MLDGSGGHLKFPAPEGTEAIVRPGNLFKKVTTLLNFRGASMVTTFVRSAGSRTQGVWKFLEKARQIDAGVRLAKLKHLSLRKMQSYCMRRVPIYVHPSFYRSLKVRYPMDVGGVSRDGRVTTELDTGPLRHALGILTSENFRTIVNSGKWVRMTLNVASLNMRGLRDASKCTRLLGELSNLCVNVAGVQETHFTCREDCRVVLENDLVVF